MSVCVCVCVCVSVCAHARTPTLTDDHPRMCTSSECPVMAGYNAIRRSAVSKSEGGGAAWVVPHTPVLKFCYRAARLNLLPG
jgi:hypothetical protein